VAGQEHDDDGLWVFAYGSLLWDPGFQPVQAMQATLAGWRRQFCMTSVRYRGTEDAPGLVLALNDDPGANCAGLALRIAAEQAAAVLSGLRARELTTAAYREARLPVRLADGRSVPALVYVINRADRQYCNHDRDTQAAIIARARGARGPNRDYLFATAARLAELGIADPELDWLAARVRAMAGL